MRRRDCTECVIGSMGFFIPPKHAKSDLYFRRVARSQFSVVVGSRFASAATGVSVPVFKPPSIEVLDDRGTISAWNGPGEAGKKPHVGSTTSGPNFAVAEIGGVGPLFSAIHRRIGVRCK